MILTSLRRLFLYCAGDTEDPLANTIKNRRVFNTHLPSVSANIENYLRRKILLDNYTEYRDTKNQKVEYYLDATPIYALADVYEDSLAMWTGMERQIQYATMGQTLSSVINPFVFNYIQSRALRVRYIGGLARHAVNSRYAFTAGTSTMTVGNLVAGAISGAVGYVVAISSTVITIEVYYGTFQAGETIQVFADENLTSGGATGTIDYYPEYGIFYYTGNEVYTVGNYVKGHTSGAIARVVSLSGTPVCSTVLSANTIIDGEAVDVCSDAACNVVLFTNVLRKIENRSLVEVAPEIVAGCEMQIRYERKHALDYENISSSRDGMSRRGTDSHGLLLPEVRDKISKYRNYNEW